MSNVIAIGAVRSALSTACGRHTIWLVIGVCMIGSLWAPRADAETRATGYSYADVNVAAQPKMVKIFGAGGLRNLESYQSGFLISAEGHILTAWSYVLDTEQATVLLHDGQRYTAELVGADPRTEIAVLKIDGADLPHFQLDDSQRVLPGTRVLAFANVYGVATGDEPTSVLHGSVAGITQLSARRGSFQTPYQGDVYILDAMTNNAGAAGGALTTSRGQLIGVLGKELRDTRSNIWLNYALPIDAIRETVNALRTGRPPLDDTIQRRPEQTAQLDRLGVILIPNILRNTPPFVDLVAPGSAAARAGLKADDLIALVDGQTVSSQAAVKRVLQNIDAVDPVPLTVLRDSQLIEIKVSP